MSKLADQFSQEGEAVVVGESAAPSPMQDVPLKVVDSTREVEGGAEAVEVAALEAVAWERVGVAHSGEQEGQQHPSLQGLQETGVEPLHAL